MTRRPTPCFLFSVTTPIPTDGPAPPPDPHQDWRAAHGRTVRVLRLVRALIIFGKTLAVTVRGFSTAETNHTIGWRFGTRNAAIILARISHGLHLAASLEARLADRVAQRGYKPPPAHPAAPSSASAPLKPRRRPTPRDSAVSPIADLPTAEELAKQFRRRPVHAVLADIVADLGLMQSDPLWSKVERAVCELNGSVIKLLKELWNRPSPTASTPARVSSVQPKLPPISQPFLVSYRTVSTGPPWPSEQLRKRDRSRA